MPNYALYHSDKIINVIVAESKEVAESATGMFAIETEGDPWIGWTLEEEGWRIPPPYASWVWGLNGWESPIPKPEDENEYVWNEEMLEWIPVEETL